MKMLLGASAAMLALASAAQANADSKAAGLKGNPGEFFGPDEYPPEAIRAGQEGRVVAKLWIDTTGKVASCTVMSSSGSPSLDQATCRIALDRVTFTPAIDRKGQPIAASYTLPVRWVLPKGPTEAAKVPSDQLVEVTVSVDATGQVVACNATSTPSLPSQFQPCAAYPVGKETEFRWVRDGKPVGGTVIRTIHQRVAIDP